MMEEVEFDRRVRRWLIKEGYDLSHYIQMAVSDTALDRRFHKESYEQLYINNLSYVVLPSSPIYIFVKKICGKPDIIGIKDGIAQVFEVKTSLRGGKLDRCVGQCLRYLTDSWTDDVTVVILAGAEGISLFRKIISQWHLPIYIIELTASGRVI